MKGINVSKALLAVTLLAVLGMTIVPAAAQITWSSDIRLTDDPAYSKKPSIAVDSNDNMHIAWYDKRDGSYEIYYTKLDNDGNTLLDDTRLTDVSAISSTPHIAVDSNDNMHIAWHDKRDDNYEIYYTKLDNNGNTLVDDTRLTDALDYSRYVSIAVDSSGNVHIAWSDRRDGHYEIYYTKLDNNGNTLVDDTRLTFDTPFSDNPSIAVDSSGNVHIAYKDERDGNREIYYTKLDGSNGNTLVDDTRLTDAPSDSHFPSIAVDSNDNIHIAWEDYRDGDLEIYYTELDNNGNTVVDDTRLTDALARSEYPSIAIDSSDNIHIAWEDYRDGDLEIYYTELDNNGNTVVDDTRLTDAPEDSLKPWIAVDSSDNVHIVWSDLRDGNYETYYKKGSAPAAAQPDLTTTDIAINPACTSVDDQLFVNESNELCAVIENLGAGDAAAFDVCFTADGASIGCASVTAGLPAGANTTVCIDWTPDCTYNPASRGTGMPVTINVTADCTCAECPVCTPGSCGVIDEEDEYNNTLSLDTAVYENGYKSKNFACGKEPLELHTYTEMYGGVVYNVSGTKNYPFEPAETDTRVHTVAIPSGMTVKEARLYVYWYDYFYNPAPGYLADLEVTVAGITHTSPNAAYNDQKGFGSYNTPKGTYAYDVTSQITGSGDYTVIVENTGAYNTTLIGETLVVIYEDPAMNPDNWMKLWMLEGCDYIKGDASYCVATEESTATVTFPGAINTPGLASAELITVVAQGMKPGANMLINGATVATDVWDADSEAYPNSKINVDVEDVTTILAASDNTLGFEDNGTGGMQASCAILVAREGAATNRVYLSPAYSSASNGDTATVEVYADTTDDFQGGQFYLEYPTGCAEVIDVTFDSMWPFTTKDLVTYPGAVFATFRKDPPMVSGTQHICTLTIQCNNPEYCTGDLHFALAADAPSGKDSKLFDDGGTPLADIAWHDGTFACMNLPDLVITEVYGEQTTGDEYIVHYTVENQGNAAAAADHDTTLYVDGVMIEHKAVPVALALGESHTDTFNTVLSMTLPNDQVKVSADNYGEVMELDEYNNYLENYYPAGIELRVNVLDDGECVGFQEQFLVNITVDPRNIPVYGIEYVLSFDNTVLHAEWQNEGTFLNDGADTNMYINTIDNGAGTISFAATRTGVDFGVTTPGTLAVIKFTAMQQGGSSNLNLSEVVAANEDGNEIDPLDLIDDSVCVSSNMPPVAIGESMHTYNNDGQKYICKVYFNGTESYDPDGTLVNWRWSFGDGNYGTGELTDHVYQSWNWNGASYDPFTVSLTVTDDADPNQLDNTVEFDVIVYTAGDANGDGKVNILDATIVGLEWGATSTNGGHCWEGQDRADKADLNNDCKVNILDAVIIGTCWGHTA